MNKLVYRYRSIFRGYLLNILSSGAKPHAGIHILNGHFLSVDNSASLEIFQKLLENLNENGVKFINFEEAVNRIIKSEFPKNECLVAFTWDDGFEECFSKIKPVLDTWNLKAAFFINPNFIDGDSNYRENFKKNIVLTDKNPMAWQMIKQMSAEGHTIGAHTLDHLSLKTENVDFLRHQIEGSKKRIEEHLNVEIKHFAFPFGQLKYISNVGVEIACETFPYVYSQDNYRNYFSFGGRVINRRHFECDWPLNHVLYFLKSKSL